MKKILIAIVALSILIPSISTASVKKATLVNTKTGYYKVVVVGSQEAHHFFGLGYSLWKSDNLGFNVITNYKTVLSRQITSNASILYVSSLQTKDGHTIVNSDTNSVFYITVEPGLSSEEIVLCTNASSTITAFTGCTRGLAYYGTSTASVVSNRYPHQAGSTIIMSNVNYTLTQYVDKDSNQTVGGNKTFSNGIISPSVSGMTLPISSQTGNAATVGYVNNVALSGAPNASITVKGIVQIASSSSYAVGTANGSTGAVLVIPSSAVASTTATKTMIPATKSNGKLDIGFIDQTAKYNFTNFRSASSTLATTSFTIIPRIPTSTPTIKGQVVALNNSAKLPAVDASQLLNVPFNPYLFTVSDNLKWSADNEGHFTANTSGTWAGPYKSIQLNGSGVVRVKFDGKYTDNRCGASGIIYVNGVASGATHELNYNAYATYSDDVNIYSIGGYVQLYLRSDSNCIYNDDYYKNFRVYFDYTRSTTTGNIIQN